VNWAINEKRHSQRRACALVGIDPKTYRYRSKRPDDAVIRKRLRELAAERRRFGYRRLHTLLRREGVEINWKKLYRLYREERLTVRKRGGRKRALGTRRPMTIPQSSNQRWSLDFVSDALVDSRRFRIRQGRMIFSAMTVEENIETGLAGSNKTKISDDIYELFPVLLEMKDRRGGNLSGGQQQQLAIARALVSEPKILLLDEPTEGIQPSIIKEIAQVLRRIRDERGLSILFSEQVLSFVMDAADRIMVIENGNIVHEDMREDVNEETIIGYLSV